MHPFQSLLMSVIAISLIVNGKEKATVIKQAIFTPTASSTQDGATLLLSNDVTVNGNEWDLIVQDQIGWHFRIDLDSSWGFSDTELSRLRLIVNGTTPTTSPDLDLLLAFSVDNSYFSLQLFMDNKDDNRISPPCPSSDATSFKYGDVNNKVNNDTGQERATKLMEPWGEIQPSNFPEHPNQWPMEFVLENDPIASDMNAVIHTHGNSSFEQNCFFTGVAFTSDYPISIFIAGDDNNEVYNLSTVDSIFSA